MTSHALLRALLLLIASLLLLVVIPTVQAKKSKAVETSPPVSPPPSPPAEAEEETPKPKAATAGEKEEAKDEYEPNSDSFDASVNGEGKGEKMEYEGNLTESGAFEMEYEEYERSYPELKDCKTSHVPVSTDEWSHGLNPNCTFPFLFRGNIYYECTNVEYSGVYWCANSCNYREGNFMRGTCVDQRDAQLGVLGTGYQLTVTNIFFGTLITIALFLLMILGCLSCRDKRGRYATVSNRVVEVFEEGLGTQSSVEIAGFEMGKTKPAVSAARNGN